ncbi:hypothetical protein [Streptomyces sp. NPDC058678]|uniref:hypothetical protein n=1 Tax=Streptomyces sp. NPDC058678 TaxID=3346595 RepID=UPI00365CACF7
MTDPEDPYRSIRRTEYTLLLIVVVLGAVGVVTETVWLLVIAAWVLIAAGLMEMFFRP